MEEFSIDDIEAFALSCRARRGREGVDTPPRLWGKNGRVFYSPSALARELANLPAGHARSERTKALFRCWALADARAAVEWLAVKKVAGAFYLDAADGALEALRPRVAKARAASVLAR